MPYRRNFSGRRSSYKSGGSLPTKKAKRESNENVGVAMLESKKAIFADCEFKNHSGKGPAFYSPDNTDARVYTDSFYDRQLFVAEIRTKDEGKMCAQIITHRESASIVGNLPQKVMIGALFRHTVVVQPHLLPSDVFFGQGNVAMRSLNADNRDVITCHDKVLALTTPSLTYRTQSDKSPRDFHFIQNRSNQQITYTGDDHTVRTVNVSGVKVVVPTQHVAVPLAVFVKKYEKDDGSTGKSHYAVYLVGPEGDCGALINGEDPCEAYDSTKSLCSLFVNIVSVPSKAIITSSVVAGFDQLRIDLGDGSSSEFLPDRVFSRLDMPFETTYDKESRTLSCLWQFAFNANCGERPILSRAGKVPGFVPVKAKISEEDVSSFVHAYGKKGVNIPLHDMSDGQFTVTAETFKKHVERGSTMVGMLTTFQKGSYDKSTLMSTRLVADSVLTGTAGLNLSEALYESGKEFPTMNDLEKHAVAKNMPVAAYSGEDSTIKPYLSPSVTVINAAHPDSVETYDQLVQLLFSWKRFQGEGKTKGRVDEQPILHVGRGVYSTIDVLKRDVVFSLKKCAQIMAQHATNDNEEKAATFVLTAKSKKPIQRLRRTDSMPDQTVFTQRPKGDKTKKHVRRKLEIDEDEIEETDIDEDDEDNYYM